MNKPTSETVVCETCGVANARRAFRCSQCGKLLPAGRADPASLHHPMPNKHAVDVDERLVARESEAGLGMLAIVLAIGVLVFFNHAGLGVPIVFCCLPPLIRTIMLVRHRRSLGKSTSPQQKFASFLGSLGVVLTACFLLMLSAGATFFVACFASLGSGRIVGDEFVWIPIVVSGVVILLIFMPWIARRWHSDSEDW